MAVLIQRAWGMPGGDDSDIRTVTAILPSGTILTPDDDEGPFGSPRSDLQSFIGVWKLRGKSEAEIFNDIDQEFGSMWGRFLVVEDPNRARDIIKNAGLTSTITPRERSEYRDYNLSVGDGTQISNAEIRMKESLEQSNGNGKEKA